MAAYALAQLTIHDREPYDRYAAAFMGVFTKFGGRVLAADESPEVLEGSWEHDKVVLLEFPDRESLQRWATSPEYVEIAADRKAGATGPVLLVHGF